LLIAKLKEWALLSLLIDYLIMGNTAGALLSSPIQLVTLVLRALYGQSMKGD
jgi:hypothetical protein